MNSSGVPVGPVYTAKDVFADPQVAARKMLVSIEDPDVGTYQFARSPSMLSSAPEIETHTAPHLGEHTWEVLEELLGYGAAEINRLHQEQVVEVAR